MRPAKLLVTLAVVVWSAAAESADSAEFFERKIRPVLANNCIGCHNAKLKTAGLDLSSSEGFLKGGSNGPVVSKDDPASSRLLQVLSYQQPVKMPPQGKLASQEIADFTSWVNAGAPWPKASAAAAHRVPGSYPFTEEQKRFWAFQPVRDYPPPQVSDASWVKSSIDRFILAKLEGKGLKPAPAADKRTLIRRATFDLTGLPPTPKEIDDFLADTSPDAFARVVDRLLRSPRYGERWGRHWLDVARYADSTGADEDIRYPYAYRYRDYVIDAFNRDLPYDRFIKEQLAGDLLPADKPGEVNVRGIVATGFLAVGLKLLAEQDKPKMVYDMVDEQLDTTSRAFMGLTVACARCHDHKFDPIPTQDYYSMAGIFASTKSLSKVEGTVSQLYFAPLVPKPVYEKYEGHQKKIKSKLKQIQAVASVEAARRTAALLPRLADYMMAAYEYAHLPRSEWKLCIEDFARRKYLDAAALERWINYLTPSDDVRPELDEWFRAAAVGEAAARAEAAKYQQRFAATLADWEQKLAEWRDKVTAAAAQDNEPPDKPAFQGGKDRFFATVSFDASGPFRIAEPSAVFGPGKKIPASHEDPLYSTEANARIRVLDADIAELLKTAPPEPEMASGVTEGANVEQHVLIRGDAHNPGPLAPRRFLRVIAGDQQPPITSGSGRLQLAEWLASPTHPLTARVIVNRIWQFHFGQGLVRTPNNFGQLGDRPTHPELLDYLARRFVEQGWSIKAMHRMIMLSNAYQMSSRVTKQQAEADPDNLLLSHFNRRRLDVEEIRDALLAMDGSLDLTMGGTLQSGFGTDGENSSERLSIDPTTSRRRTVYLPLRRSNLPSLLNLFDFGDATTPGEGRANTNVAPQALFMMNSRFISERSRSFAKSMAETITAKDDDARRLEWAFLRILNRLPEPEEVRKLTEYLGAFQTKLAASGTGTKDATLSAWQSVCHILMASNEFIYVD